MRGKRLMNVENIEENLCVSYTSNVREGRIENMTLNERLNAHRVSFKLLKNKLLV